MFEEVQVLSHSSIRISGEKILYFDPFEISQESHDADVVFVTHDHYDHYSPEDIKKVAGKDTVLVLPECMKGQEEKSGISDCIFVRPGEGTEVAGLLVQAVSAYNNGRPFHTKEKEYVGYLVTMAGVIYYVAGDTDAVPENRSIKCDVALVPVGGKFTMDCKEAAKLVNEIMPKLAIPTHYGTVVGTPQDGSKFAELVNDGIEVRVQI